MTTSTKKSTKKSNDKTSDSPGTAVATQEPKGGELSRKDQFKALLAQGKQKAESRSIAAMLGDGGGFLPRIKLAANGAEVVKDGKVVDKHFILLLDSDNFTDLGEAFDATFVMYRPRAERWNTDGELVECIFDENCDEYAAVKEQCEKDDAARIDYKKKTCKYGPEILMYVHNDSFRGWCTWYLGFNPSHRFVAKTRLAKWLDGPGPVDMTVGTKPANAKGNKFTAPQVLPASSPLPELDAESGAPVLERFLTEQSKTQETVADEGADRR